jgi:hypothetical protein
MAGRVTIARAMHGKEGQAAALRGRGWNMTHTSIIVAACRFGIEFPIMVTISAPTTE